jgi:hypothetical protein
MAYICEGPLEGRTLKGGIGRMTRATQKQKESEVLRQLLFATGIQPECEPDVTGDKPDVMMRMFGRTVGIEVVTYQSGGTVVRAGRRRVERRAVESEWERLKTYSKEFQEKHPDLNDIYILFRFKSIVPPQEEYDLFLEEILRFVRSRQEAVSAEYVEFGMADFPSPLMKKYLKPIRGITLRRGERGELDSNITAGYVDSHPASTISKIVSKKAEKAKEYRKADELWLAIGQSGQLSEMVLPINGACDFDASPDLQESLLSSPFSRVYVFTAMGLFRWDKREGNWQLNTGKEFF